MSLALSAMAASCAALLGVALGRAARRTASPCAECPVQSSPGSAAHQKAKAFERAFEDAAHGMALLSPDGRWMRVNRALEDLLGYTSEELTGGMTFADVTHPDDLAGDLELFERLKAGRIARYTYQKRYIRRDNSVVHIMLAVGVVRFDDGGVDFFVSQIIDRTRDEAELRHLRDRLAEAELEVERNRIRLAIRREQHLADIDSLSRGRDSGPNLGGLEDAG